MWRLPLTEADTVAKAFLGGDRNFSGPLAQSGHPDCARPAPKMALSVVSLRCRISALSAHVGHRVAIKLDLRVRVLVLPAGRSIPFEFTTGTILARIRYA